MNSKMGIGKRGPGGETLDVQSVMTTFEEFKTWRHCAEDVMLTVPLMFSSP